MATILNAKKLKREKRKVRKRRDRKKSLDMKPRPGDDPERIQGTLEGCWHAEG